MPSTAGRPEILPAPSRGGLDKTAQRYAQGAPSRREEPGWCRGAPGSGSWMPEPRLVINSHRVMRYGLLAVRFRPSISRSITAATNPAEVLVDVSAPGFSAAGPRQVRPAAGWLLSTLTALILFGRSSAAGSESASPPPPPPPPAAGHQDAGALPGPDAGAFEELVLSSRVSLPGRYRSIGEALYMINRLLPVGLQCSLEAADWACSHCSQEKTFTTMTRCVKAPGRHDCIESHALVLPLHPPAGAWCMGRDAVIPPWDPRDGPVYGDLADIRTCIPTWAGSGTGAEVELEKAYHRINCACDFQGEDTGAGGGPGGPRPRWLDALQRDLDRRADSPACDELPRWWQEISISRPSPENWRIA